MKTFMQCVTAEKIILKRLYRHYINKQ